MTTESSLIIRVDSTSAKRATDDLDHLTAASARAETATGKLSTTSTTAARAVQGHGAATATAATQAAELAESEEQAAKRIHDMVQASLAAAQASNTRVAAENAAATASRSTADAIAIQGKSWKDIAAAQTEAMQRYTAMRAPVNELQAILAKSTLTSAEVAKAEALLDAAQASGIITAGELSEAFTALDAAKIKDIAVTEAQAVANKTAWLNSRAQSEIATAASEVLSGNFGRLRRTGAAFANQAGLLTKLMSPMGLAILGVSGAVIALITAYAKGESEQAAFNKALILTGDYAGQTAGQLDAMAKSLDGVGGATQHTAAGVLAQVVQSGKFFGDQIKTVAAAALELQQTTGQAVDKTIEQFVKLGKDPVQGLLDLNESMHFLTQATYDQVTALVQRGQTDKAAAVKQDAYAAAVKQRAADVQESLGTLEKVLHGVTGAWHDFWDAAYDIGRPTTLQDRITDVQRQLIAAQAALESPDIRNSSNPVAAARGIDLQSQGLGRSVLQQRVNDLQARLAQLLAQQHAEGGFTAGQALADRLIGERIAAQQALSEGAGTSAQDKLNARLNYLAEQKAKALLGVVDPAKRDHIIAQFNAQVAEAAQQFNSAEKRLNPTGPKANAFAEFQRQVADLTAKSMNTGSDAVSTYTQGVLKLIAGFDKATKGGKDVAAATALYDQGIKALGADLEAATLKQNAAIKAYQDAADAQTAAQKAQLDMRVASLAMGDREAAQAQALAEIRQQSSETIRRLTSQRNQALSINPRADTSVLDAQIDTEKRALGERLANQEKYYSDVTAAQSDWQVGATAALQNFMDQASDVAGQTRDLFTDAFNGMADSLANFVTTGKGNFGDLTRSILADLVKMEARILISQVLTSLFMRDGTAIASNYMANGGATYAASGVNWNVGLLGAGRAMGGPVLPGSIHPVVENGPELLSTSQGTYLMMGNTGGQVEPLGRPLKGGASASGDVYLSVEVKGGDGNAKVSKSQTTDGQGNRLIKLVIDQTKADLTKEVVRGGPFGQALQQTFGLSRRGIPVSG